jgi:hypothetical protein
MIFPDANPTLGLLIVSSIPIAVPTGGSGRRRRSENVTALDFPRLKHDIRPQHPQSFPTNP